MIIGGSSASLFASLGAQSSAAKTDSNALNSFTELTEEEEKQVQELKARDQEVRAHENAHKTAGGGYVGAISYDTQTGPDGREYAIGGEAQIDASPVEGNPQATISKMDIVIRAALAPAEPSSQDYAVARAAQAARIQAQQELSEQRAEENNNPALQSAVSQLYQSAGNNREKSANTVNIIN